MGARQRGRGFSPKSQELYDADDYLREEIARRAAGQARFPVETTLANVGGSIAQGMAVPGVRAAQGAGLLARTGAGLANVGVDTAIASGGAALSAPPGQEALAARSAAAPAAMVSGALRAPVGAAP